MERTAWTDERIDDMVDRIDQRFDQVDRRFEEVDRRFDKVDARMDHLDQKVDALGERLGERMDEGFREIRGELAALNARLFNAAIVMIAAMLSVFVALLIHSA